MRSMRVGRGPGLRRGRWSARVLDDLLGGGVEGLVAVGLHPDSDLRASQRVILRAKESAGQCVAVGGGGGGIEPIDTRRGVVSRSRRPTRPSRRVPPSQKLACGSSTRLRPPARREPRSVDPHPGVSRMRARGDEDFAKERRVPTRARTALRDPQLSPDPDRRDPCMANTQRRSLIGLALVASVLLPLPARAPRPGAPPKRRRRRDLSPSRPIARPSLFWGFLCNSRRAPCCRPRRSAPTGSR